MEFVNKELSSNIASVVDQRRGQTGRDPRRGRDRNRRSNERRDEFDRKVINIRRVAKVRAGAKRLRFSAMVAVGDKKGKVCVAIGRGVDTRAAINKAYKYASEHLVLVELVGDTIPHEVFMKYRAAKLMIKPAGPGTGVTASGPVRAVMEVAGVRNVLTKQLGTDNPITNGYCAFEALKELRKKRVLESRTKRLKSNVKRKAKSAPASDSKKKK